METHQDFQVLLFVSTASLSLVPNIYSRDMAIEVDLLLPNYYNPKLMEISLGISESRS